ncbi:MAG: tRNA pseudouridine(55) synthase TruB [Bacteroidia bacterium]|nr:tRNA pseudouridine(55) synthase TruB [Bacteroidia bacterium]
MKPYIGQDGGIILINKPVGWTSFQLVKKIKNLLEKNFRLSGLPKTSFKVGHTGTLDPLAEGLMIVCYGNQTKNISHFLQMDKVYEGIMVLGKTTPSYDLETPPDKVFPTEHITEDIIRNVAASFVGEQFQEPPLFSAIKIEGKRAYELARKGEEKKLMARPVFIHAFEIQKILMPEVYFRIHCSKGTYIRSIARDFGLALHSGAYIQRLMRINVGPYKLEDAWDLDEADEMIQKNLSVLKI